MNAGLVTKGVSAETLETPLDPPLLIAWEYGHYFPWDFTSCDTLAPSHRARAQRGLEEVVNYAEEQKCDKYASLTRLYVVFIEFLSALGDCAKALTRKISQRVKENKEEPRSTSFFIQRIALDVQHGNAASVLGTISAWREVVGLLPS